MRVLIQLNKDLQFQEYSFEKDDRSCLDLVFFVEDHVDMYDVLYDEKMEENKK